MRAHGQVSESAASALTLEIVAYLAQRNKKKEVKDNDSNDDDPQVDSDVRAPLQGVTHHDPLQCIGLTGVSIGYRIAERLLSRELNLWNPSPADIVSFIRLNMWQAMFGRKIEHVSGMEGLYFVFVDSGFKLFKGFPKSTKKDPISTAEVVHAPGYGSGVGPTDSGETAPTSELVPDHREVLMFVTGIIRGALEVICTGPAPTVQLNVDGDNRVTVKVDFRSLK